MLNFMKSS